MNELLSIVIVEYRSIDEIDTCVRNIEANMDVPYEVIVSSNSCYTEEEKKAINISNSNVRWIYNAENGGFAYAMNEGLKVAKGDYLVIMNSDCIINSGLSEMMSFMETHPEVGALGPQMRDAEGNIQDTARPYVTPYRFFKRQLIRVIGRKVSILNKNMDYSKVQTVDWVIGAFIMVSRSAYEKVGGLDHVSFFMYAEDIDWCTRIHIEGFEVVYFPKVIITYKGTRRARTTMKYAKIFIKSHLAYWRKYGFIYGYPKRKEIVFDEN